MTEASPWVETRAGGVFFINALLATPLMITLYPWSLRWLLRVTGLLDRPSRILDPIPAVAAHFAPVVGLLALPALAFTLHGLRLVDRRWARVLLVLFAIGHIGTLIYTVAAWMA